jgi:hypothetical protein
MQTRRSILSALATLPFWGLAARGLSMEEEPRIKVTWWEQEPVVGPPAFTGTFSGSGSENFAALSPEVVKWETAGDGRMRVEHPA